MKKNILKVSSALMCAAVAGSSAVAPIMSNVSAKSTTSVDATSIVADDGDAITFDSKESECPFLVSVKQNDLGGSATVKPGDKIKYDVTIRNTSDKAVSGMVMYMALPSGVKYVSSAITQDNGEERYDSYKAMASWAKGEGLLTIKPAAKYEDKSPTIDAGDTLSFELVGEVESGAKAADVKTNLEVHYTDADGKKISVNSADIVTTITSLKNCVIKLDANGGKAVDAIAVKEGEAVSSLPDTTREGFTFDGWYTAADGGDKVTSLENVTDDTTLYAHWIANTYTLTFDSQGGDAIDAITASAADEIKSLPAPNRENYLFEGWYTAADGGEKVTKLSLVKDTTLYAHWKSVHYTITFDAQGGSEVAPIVADVGNLFTAMPETTRENYVFDGWYTEPSGGVRVTQIEDGKDVTLYAHWSEATYVLTFDTQGADTVGPIRFGNSEMAGIELPTPARDDYKFEGWFTEPEGGEKVTEITNAADATLYAHWTAISDDSTTPSDPSKPSDGSDKKDDSTTKPDDGSTTKPDDGSNKKDDNTAKPDDGKSDGTTTPTPTPDNGSDNTNNGSTSTDDGSSKTDDNSDAEVRTYKLTVISADGTTTNVSVKSTVTLDALVQKLGYTNAKTYKMTTASGSGTDLSADTTMKDIADATSNGEVLVIAYDESGKAIGSGKVTNTGTDEFRVSLSKDTNVSLSDNKGTDASDKTGVDGKGKGETDTQGKSDSTASAVKTADVGVIPALGGMGGVMSTLLGVLAVFKRKRS